MILLAAVPLALWNLDLNDGGFVSGGSTGQWAWGVPTSGPGGPGRVWATALSGPYLNDATDTLEVQLPDLSAATRPMMRLDHWWEIAAGDSGVVELLDHNVWGRVAPVGGYPSIAGFTGLSGAYETSTFSLPSTATRARFVLHSNESGSAAGWYLRAVEVWDGDVAPPVITAIDVPSNTSDLVGPYIIRLSVADDDVVTEVTVDWTADGVAQEPLIASNVGGDEWDAALPGQAPGTRVAWTAVATDGAQSASFPETGAASFRVFLPAPTGLDAPAVRLVSTSVRLVWDPPLTDEPIAGYRVVELGGDGADVTVALPFADVPVETSGSHIWVVAAEYDAGYGDASAALQADVDVPALISIDPASAWPGDRVRIRLVADSAYFEDGVTDFAMDDAVLHDLVVRDVNVVEALVTIDEQAPPGPRDVVLHGAYGDVAFHDAFTVENEGVRPAIHAVPGGVPQGFEGTVTFSASEPFAGPVVVDGGPGIVATESSVDGAVATVSLAVGQFTTPGVHTVIIDDGRRLWVATIVILDRVVSSPGGCDSFGGAVSTAGALLAAFMIRRRRRSPRRDRSQRG